ncbi:MAG TPA: methyltransferase domain-containing protein [Ktedonobacteraceae bacterium]|nr:methyltransferase domain-containing protein [Ktedonobacteraceae bacterium]
MFTNRPFYTDFAWAYDQIIEEPGQEHYDHIAQIFASAGSAPGSRLLDAGCGAGRYALALARRGYQVIGVDAAPSLLREAQRKAAEAQLAVTFEVGNLLNLTAKPACDGILCRGVLNDLLDDASRQNVFQEFASVLRKSGVLVLDVREWRTTVQRKRREPFWEKQVATERGLLTYQSRTALEEETRTLHITERHQLQQGKELITADYAFAMRCWLQEELHALLEQAGFEALHYFGAYNSQIPVGVTDRIVAIARLISAPMRGEDAR